MQRGDDTVREPRGRPAALRRRAVVAAGPHRPHDRVPADLLAGDVDRVVARQAARDLDADLVRTARGARLAERRLNQLGVVGQQIQDGVGPATPPRVLEGQRGQELLGAGRAVADELVDEPRSRLSFDAVPIARDSRDRVSSITLTVTLRWGGIVDDVEVDTPLQQRGEVPHVGDRRDGVRTG